LKEEDYFEKELYSNMSAEIKDYIDKRFVPQVNWYENSAKKNMIRFYVLQGIIITFGAFIPIISLYNSPGLDVNALSFSINARLISSALAAMIVIASSFVQLTKSQHNWILFRETVENLKGEYHLFCNNAGDYSDPNLNEQQQKNTKLSEQQQKNKLFIDRAEAHMKQEGSKYYALRKDEKS